MAGAISGDRRIEKPEGLVDAQLQRRPLEVGEVSSQHKCRIDGMRCWDCGNVIARGSVYVASETTISEGLRSISKTVETHPECHAVARELVAAIGAISTHSWEVGRWPLTEIWRGRRDAVIERAPHLAKQLAEAFGI